MTSVAANALRSLYPKSVLVEHRDVMPLWTKYRYGTVHRLRSLLDFSSVGDTNALPGFEYEPTKHFGSLHVEAPTLSLATGYDPKENVRIDRHDSVVGLNIKGWEGREQMYQHLGEAALYIRDLPDATHKPYIVGTTYSEMARFAVRTLGFRTMDLEVMHAELRRNLSHLHQVFCDFNGMEHSFEPAMVYMPLEQFISQYVPSEGMPPQMQKD